MGSKFRVQALVIIFVLGNVFLFYNVIYNSSRGVQEQSSGSANGPISSAGVGGVDPADGRAVQHEPRMSGQPGNQQPLAGLSTAALTANECPYHRPNLCSENDGWCDIPMPTRSHFAFDPPTDTERWRNAACVAASGENVLLKRILKEVFPIQATSIDEGKVLLLADTDGESQDSVFAAGHRSVDFLHTGEQQIKLLPMVDIFLDKMTSFEPLLAPGTQATHLPLEDRTPPAKEAGLLTTAIPPRETLFVRREESGLPTGASLGGNSARRVVNGCTGRYPVVALGYNFMVPRTRRRLSSVDGADSVNGTSPIKNDVKAKVNQRTCKFSRSNHYSKPGMGRPFSSSSREPLPSPAGGIMHKKGEPPMNGDYFSGRSQGGYFIAKERFLEMWRKNKDKITVPFVAMYVNSENWGYLSTEIPNRTIAWDWENAQFSKNMYEFLDHPMTLALVVNQHHNFSHPKIVNVPLGMVPPFSQLYEAMVRTAVSDVKKSQVLYAAASTWGPRPRITKCVQDHFSSHPKDFTSSLSSSTEKSSRWEYYKSIGRTRFVLGLPGLGYDCFRNWEVLTMGSVLVTERGVGLDRMFSKLPVLLVDDFYELTPQLLRSAYVEAVYRTHEFQFEKLKQDFWYDFLRNITNPAETQTSDGKFNSVGNSLGRTSLSAIHHYFPMSAEDRGFSRAAVLGYTGRTQQKPHPKSNLQGVPGFGGDAWLPEPDAQCLRLDLGGRMGACKRFPPHSC